MIKIGDKAKLIFETWLRNGKVLPVGTEITIIDIFSVWAGKEGSQRSYRVKGYRYRLDDGTEDWTTDIKKCRGSIKKARQAA